MRYIPLKSVKKLVSLKTVQRGCDPNRNGPTSYTETLRNVFFEDVLFSKKLIEPNGMNGN